MTRFRRSQTNWCEKSQKWPWQRVPCFFMDKVCPWFRVFSAVSIYLFIVSSESEVCPQRGDAHVNACTHTDAIALSVQLPRLSVLNLPDLYQICRPTLSDFSTWLHVGVRARARARRLCVRSAQTSATAFVSISLYSALRQTSLGRSHHILCLSL